MTAPKDSLINQILHRFRTERVENQELKNKGLSEANNDSPNDFCTFGAVLLETKEYRQTKQRNLEIKGMNYEDAKSLSKTDPFM